MCSVFHKLIRVSYISEKFQKMATLATLPTLTLTASVVPAGWRFITLVGGEHGNPLPDHTGALTDFFESALG
jgi:hypothetical protein